MFGITSGDDADRTVDAKSGNVTDFSSTQSKISLVTNLILVDPAIEVAQINTLNGSNVNVQYDDMSGGAAGLAVGKVGGSAHSIGVYGGKLAVRKTGYTTFNSIVGYVDTNVTVGVTGGGNRPQSTGDEFGSSLDVTRLTNRLINISSYGSNSPYLPKVTNTNNSYSLESGQYMPLSVTNTVSKTYYSKENAEEVISKYNTGYFIGNDSKAYANNIVFKSSNTPRAFYEKTSSGTTPLSDEKMTEITKNAKNIARLLPSSDSTVNYGMLRFQQVFSSDNVIKNATVTIGGTPYKNAIIPDDCIWFTPSSAGKIRFVIYTATYTDADFAITKFSRGGNFSQEIPTDDIETTSYTDLEKRRLYYIEYNVSEEDVANHAEFVLGKSKNSGVYLLYIDIGTTEHSGALESGDVDKTLGVSAIDFIYKDVIIADGSQTDGANAFEEGNFIVPNGKVYSSYTPTGTSVYFEDYAKAIVLAFIRDVNGTSVDFTVKADTVTSMNAIYVTVDDKLTTIVDSTIAFTFD
jgi:hypothetical protein